MACPRRNFLCQRREGKGIQPPPEDLKDGLKKTAYAISTDETRYVLNGTYIKDSKLTLVAAMAAASRSWISNSNFPAATK